MKVGDLIKIVEYPSRHTPLNTRGIIIKELGRPFEHQIYHQCYEVRFDNGYIGRHADFCLEVLSESRRSCK